MPIMAIDPEQGYREWVERFLWHVDQLPLLLIEPSGYLALTSLHTTRWGLESERVSGSGYIDNVPIVDGPEGRRSRAVWEALRAYLAAASSRVGVEAPVLPVSVPNDLTLARDWAYSANQWLADRVHEINDHPDLSGLEEALFGLIRRARRGQPDAPTVRREPPELCGVCGTNAVLIEWVNGTAQEPVLAKVCKQCGDVSTETPNLEEES